MDEQRKQFLETESTPDDDTIKTVEMTTKNLDYDINQVDKAMAGFERIDISLERCSVGHNAIKQHCM